MRLHVHNNNHYYDRKIIFLFILLASLKSAFSSPRNIFNRQDGDEEENFSILMIGNSYTSYNQGLDTHLQFMLESANDVSGQAEKLTRGGMKLFEHATSWQGSPLDTDTFDFVILQDQSQLPSFLPSDTWYQRSRDGAIVLDSRIEAAGGAETIFFLTWGHRFGDSQNGWRSPDYLSMQANLEAGYKGYAEAVAEYTNYERIPYIAPVGLAFKKIHDDIVADGGIPTEDGTLFSSLYTSDSSHPTPRGTYLASCVIFSTITGISSLTLPATPNFVSDLDIDTRLQLQQASDAIVFDNSLGYAYPWFRSTTSTPTTFNPTSVPTTALPSTEPTESPSKTPSFQPILSIDPSTIPSEVPSMHVSDTPTTSLSPSLESSSTPSMSVPPSSLPTRFPSSTPSSSPNAGPSPFPTTFPSSTRSFMPSSDPSSAPSELPSSMQSSTPSRDPSPRPSGLNSNSPSASPKPSMRISSSTPTVKSSSMLSGFPSDTPSFIPSTGPSLAPSTLHSNPSTFMPSTDSSSKPSKLPSYSPSLTTRPSLSPSTISSSMPTIKPQEQAPTTLPTSISNNNSSPSPASTANAISGDESPTPVPSEEESTTTTLAPHDSQDIKQLNNNDSASAAGIAATSSPRTLAAISLVGIHLFATMLT